MWYAEVWVCEGKLTRSLLAVFSASCRRLRAPVGILRVSGTEARKKSVTDVDRRHLAARTDVTLSYLTRKE